MSAIDPIMQERVYRALKSDYLAGRFRPGQRLDLQSIADRLRASKTPVREAVHRLIGERLVEPDPEGGFRIIALAPSELIQMLAWNAHLLLGLTRMVRASVLRATLARFPAAPVGSTPLELARMTGTVFLACAESTANFEAAASVAQLNERLLCARIADAADGAETVRELRTLTNVAVSDVPKNFRRRIEAYHERRIERLRRLGEAAPFAR